MATTYAKTAAGQNEIETRARRISPRHRSLLILIDGKRTDAELGALVQQFDETLPALLEAGLIEVVATTPAKPSKEPPVAPEVAPAAPAGGEDFQTMRREAVRAVNDLLGPSGESLALRLERAADAEELRAALERAVAYIANARGGGAAAQFASRFVKP
jgi:hypothetical protein